MSVRRIVLGALLATAALATGALSSRAEALPNHMTYRTYFSSAAKTTEVGEKILLCCWVGCNNTMVWGTTSSYYSDSSESCN